MAGSLALALAHAFALALVVAASGCGHSALYYDALEIRHPALKRDQQRAVAQAAAGRLSGRALVWVDADGRERAVVPTEAGLMTLPLPVLGALWLATSKGDRGGENDLRVHIAGKGSVPVTVYQALDGSVRVLSPRGPSRSGDTGDDDAVDAAREGTPSAEQIRARFGLAAAMPGTWAGAERRALAASLELLAPAELDVLQTVQFARRGAAPDGDATHAAVYELKGCVGSITIYSSAVSKDRFAFVGEPSAPKSATLHSVLHEIGHAFEQAPARDRFCRAERAKDMSARNTWVLEGNALVEDNPVLAEYRKALGGAPGPTDYANTHMKESFAESFALFHVDPAALRRTNPSVHAWFASGAHLDVLGTARRP